MKDQKNARQIRCNTNGGSVENRACLSQDRCNKVEQDHHDLYDDDVFDKCYHDDFVLPHDDFRNEAKYYHNECQNEPMF